MRGVPDYRNPLRFDAHMRQHAIRQKGMGNPARLTPWLARRSVASDDEVGPAPSSAAILIPRFTCPRVQRSSCRDSQSEAGNLVCHPSGLAG